MFVHLRVRILDKDGRGLGGIASKDPNVWERVHFSSPFRHVWETCPPFHLPNIWTFHLPNIWIVFKCPPFSFAPFPRPCFPSHALRYAGRVTIAERIASALQAILSAYRRRGIRARKSPCQNSPARARDKGTKKGHPVKGALCGLLGYSLPSMRSANHSELAKASANMMPAPRTICQVKRRIAFMIKERGTLCRVPLGGFRV